MKSDQTVQILVRGYGRTDSTYVVYTIITETDIPEYNGTKFVVDRRYSEFEWLRRRLSQLNPGYFLPPLPGKHIISTIDQFSDDFLKIRSVGLQKFLARVSQHPVLPWAPDLMSFLRSSRQEFITYMGNNPIQNGLVEMFMDLSMRNLSYRTTDCLNNSVKLVSTDLTVVSSQRIEQEEFAHQLNETNNCIVFTQRLKRATERIAISLQELSDGYEELSQCLDAWTSSPINESERSAHLATPEFTINSKAGNASTIGSDSNQIVNVPILISGGAKAASTATQSLANELNEHMLPNWTDLSNYAKCVKTVLDSRDNLQKRYTDLLYQLKTRSVEANTDTSYSGKMFSSATSFLPWRQKPVTELLNTVSRLHDQLTVRNEQIRGDFSRWLTGHKRDTLQLLTQMTNIYAAQYSSVASDWNSLVDRLKFDRNKSTKPNKFLPPPENEPSRTKANKADDIELNGPSDSAVAKLDC